MKIDFKIRELCPHCKHPTIQTYQIHTVYDERQGGRWNGRPDTAKKPAAYFLFECKSCERVLLYHYYADPFDFEDLFPCKINGIECMSWDKKGIEQALELVWPMPAGTLPLSNAVPLQVKEAYQRASRVKNEPNSFAVQIRRALEAICLDRGQPARNLNDDLKALAKAGVFPRVVADIAHQLRETGNDGAHIRNRIVEHQQVNAIDSFFRLVVNYVYDAPAELEAYRKQLSIETAEINSNTPLSDKDARSAGDESEL